MNYEVRYFIENGKLYRTVEGLGTSEVTCTVGNFLELLEEEGY